MLEHHFSTRTPAHHHAFAVAECEVLGVLRHLDAPSRSADVVIARALGLPLKNPFLDCPDLVEDLDNEWMVVTGDRWPPLPRYTGSSDVAERTVREMFDGAMVDSLQTGPNEFRAIVHKPNGFKYSGSAWPTRPLAIMGAAFEAKLGE